MKSLHISEEKSALNDLVSFPVCFILQGQDVGYRKQQINMLIMSPMLCQSQLGFSCKCLYNSQNLNFSYRKGNLTIQKSHPIPPDMHSQRTTDEQAACSVTVLCSCKALKHTLFQMGFPIKGIVFPKTLFCLHLLTLLSFKT